MFVINSVPKLKKIFSPELSENIYGERNEEHCEEPFIVRGG